MINVKQCFDKNIIELSEQLGIEQSIVALLYERGYTNFEEMHDFLRPDSNFVSADTILNMPEACEKIKEVVASGECILIFGDYDCDGICATSILQLYFNSIGANCVHYIPRRQDGYGLSITAIEKVIEEYMPALIITVDCGISSVEEVSECLDLGVDIIVTDHHEPQAELPECLIINPKLQEDSPLRDICGASVAMKLVEGLAGREESDKYLDLATLASVADVVPLVGENRKIVYNGLKIINSKPRAGLSALSKSCDLKEIKSADIGFKLAPRINALGRLNDESDVTELFISTEPFVIDGLVEKINKANALRQQITKDMFEECLSMISAQCLREDRAIVLSNDKWEAGVLGLVSAKLVNEFYRPVVLMATTSEGLKGSCRSIEGINIFECLVNTSEYLSGFGGHAGAAGMSMPKQNEKGFRKALNDYIKRTYSDDLFIPKKSFDILLDKKSIGINYCKALELLEPTGEGNPSPKLVIAGNECKLQKLGTTPHVKGRLNMECDVVAFFKEELLTADSFGVNFDLIVEPSVREFNNRRYAQLSVSDFTITSFNSVKNNVNGFGLYLKSGLYAPWNKDEFRFSDIDNELPSSIYGTAYIAYSAETATNFLNILEERGIKELVPMLCVGTCQSNPLNTLLLSPTDFSGLEKFSSIVFLDCPLSTGILEKVSLKAPEGELVLIKSYGFMDCFKILQLADKDIIYTADKLSQYVRGFQKAKNVNDLFFELVATGYRLDSLSFTVHFYALYEMGWLKATKDFGLACKGSTPSMNSKTLMVSRRLKERAEKA